ncbi:MAG: TonB-dependent receptor, partial [Longimonas sp.]|uniref:carboxypeptidase-like regulatory domain-containing protein n=1 Tax=Longimonas sp. TaxID=2039626 RepID=UPI003976EA88
MQEAPGTLSGVVVDRTTGRPLPGATVQLSPTGRGQATDGEGQFLFRNIEPDTYELEVRFVGYATHRETVEVKAGERTRVTIDLRSQRVGLPDIVVTGAARERTTAEVYQPITALGGEELQQQLGSSIPETLQRVPGFAMQYNGPGAARPSIRGMGGDRVLMLEDGQRTGDLYQTTADHGVMMEPLTAEQIEVIRGPAGLLYGSQALGSVVK